MEVEESVSQPEVEQLTTDLSKILNIEEVAVQIIEIAYGKDTVSFFIIYLYFVTHVLSLF
jgi:hypothetical protein